MLDVQTPAAAARASRRAERNQIFYNFLRAWSIRPSDEFVKLTDSQGQLLTYPENEETKRGELLCERPSFQSRLAAKRAQVTPNVCLALPLRGGVLVATKIHRY